MILNIDTSDQVLVKVQLKDDEQVVLELTESNKFGSQVLIPLIEKLLKEGNIEYQDLTGIETSTGPGSFTGLRVGASVAQALAYGLDIPLNGKKDGTLDILYK